MTTASAWRHSVELEHDGIRRPYLLQMPPNSPALDTPATPVPLVLQLHGRGIDPVRFDELTGYGALAEQVGFALAMPSAIGEIWNDGRNAGPPGTRADDVGYLAAVLDDAILRTPIDPRRIYVVGMSNGAAMAGRLARELSERIAAMAQVAGTASADLAAVRQPALPVPILSIHGTADSTAPYGGGVRRGLVSHLMIRHAAGPSVSVDDWARFWVAANRATEGPDEQQLPPDVAVRTWHGPTSSSDVVFYRIDGGGHTWPGSHFTLPAFLFGRTSHTFDATRVSWDFLAAHRR